MAANGHTGPLLSRRSLPRFILTMLVVTLQESFLKLTGRLGAPTDGVEL